MAQYNTKPPRFVQGFTLIELMVVVIILTTIVLTATPFFQTAGKSKGNVIEAGERLYSELQKARSESITRNAPIYFKFSTGVGVWHYGVSEATGCDPTLTDHTAASACILQVDDGDGTLGEDDDKVLHRIASTEFNEIDITLAGMPAGNEIVFDPVRGTTNTNTAAITFQQSGGYILKVMVGKLGRVKLCSPAGAGHINDYSSTGC